MNQRFSWPCRYRMGAEFFALWLVASLLEPIRNEREALVLRSAILLAHDALSVLQDFFDKDKVQSKSHDIDWLRVVAKERFRNFIARKDKDLLDPVALHRELREVDLCPHGCAPADGGNAGDNHRTIQVRCLRSPAMSEAT